MLCEKILAAFVLISSTAPFVAAQTAAKPLGMILDVQGTVNIQRGRGNERALPADLLFAGDQISTAANSKVTFSFCPPSQRFSLSPDSTVAVDAAAVQQSKGAPASKAAAARCTLPQVALGKREIDHIGAMNARGAPPIPLYVGGAISTTRPHFMWEPVAAAQEYKLILRTPNGQVLWTWTGRASEVQMPQSVAELRPGNYVWELTGITSGSTVPQQTAMFEVKPSSELASIRAEGLSQVEMAAAFENAGYYSEAAAIYRTLRSQNASDPRFTRNLLWLYWEMGLFAASNDELKKVKAQK
jgi:hypothetical protein